MKISAITGANSGIGFATALDLAKEGHQVLMICRNPDKAATAKNKIIAKTGNEHVSLFLADLSDLDSIDRTASKIISELDHIDNLINNAGGMFANYQLTSIGMEQTLHINHLGHFLLTDLLLPLLLKSKDPRVINTSSAAHFDGKFDFDDLNYQDRGYGALGFSAYSRSKLANILFTKKLDRLAGDRLANFAVHPGFVGSGFNQNNGVLMKIVMGFFKIFNKSPERGAQPQIYLATAEGVEQYSGDYLQDTSGRFSKPVIKPMKSSELSYDKGLQDQLWDVSKQYILKWKEEYQFNYDLLLGSDD